MVKMYYNEENIKFIFFFFGKRRLLQYCERVLLCILNLVICAAVHIFSKI